jgi:hypothetical protein
MGSGFLVLPLGKVLRALVCLILSIAAAAAIAVVVMPADRTVVAPQSEVVGQ